MHKFVLALLLAVCTFPATAAGLLCDLDVDGNVDLDDLRIIRAWSQKPIPPAPIEADANGDGAINVADVRYCQLRCTLAGCVVF